jgi:hypothetical protein
MALVCLFMTILHHFPVAAFLRADVFQLSRLDQFSAGPFDRAQRFADSRCHLSQGYGRFFSQELQNSVRRSLCVDQFASRLRNGST